MRWPALALALRFVCLAAFAVWFGGFTFYGACVIPVLHAKLDHLQAGGITQDVTDELNAVGALAVGLAWLEAWCDRALGPRRLRVAAAALLALSTAILVFLFVWHGVMDRHLEREPMETFYPLHRVYLLASTVQWVANGLLLLAGVSLWSRAPTAGARNAPEP